MSTVTSPEYGYLCSCVLLVLMCVYVHVCQITMLRIKINCEFSIKLRVLFTVCVRSDVNYCLFYSSLLIMKTEKILKFVS